MGDTVITDDKGNRLVMWDSDENIKYEVYGKMKGKSIVASKVVCLNPKKDIK